MLGWAGKPSINVLPRYSTRTVCNKYEWEQVEDLISVSNVCGSCPGQTFSVKKSSAPNSSCQPLEDKSETSCRWGESKSLLFRVTLWPAKPVDYLKQIPSRFLHIFFSQQVKIKHKHPAGWFSARVFLCFSGLHNLLAKGCGMVIAVFFECGHPRIVAKWG